MQNNLSKIDLKIIRALQENGRLGIAEAAKKARISSPRAHYRIQKLIEEKTILGFYPLIDFSKLGYTAFRLMFRFSAPESNRRKEFMEFMINHPNCLWAAECGGRWDFLANFLEKDIYALNRLLSSIGKRFEELKLSYDFLVIGQINDLGQKRTANTEKFPQNNKTLSGMAGKIDEKDIEILGCLVADGRASIKKISKRTGIHPQTIHNRMKLLKENKILRAINPQLNAEKFGLETFKALLSLENNIKSKEKLIGYLEFLPQVVGIIETFGPWALEIEFCARNSKEAKEFLYSIREKFKNEIKDFELLPITREYKYKFIPAQLI